MDALANLLACRLTLSLSPETGAPRRPVISTRDDEARGPIVDRPVVPAALLVGGGCAGVIVGYTVIADPVAAGLGAFSGATVGMLLHRVLRMIELCTWPEHDGLDQALDKAEAALAHPAGGRERTTFSSVPTPESRGRP